MARTNPSGRKSSRKRPKRPSRDLVNYRQMFALSKKERVRIFAILCERIASPKEIASELSEGLSQVSYHVSVLRESRLIVLDHKVPRRGAMQHFYRAAVPTLIPPGAWDHLPPAMRRTISVSILEEFFADSAASMEAGIFDQSPGELSWTPLILDAEGLEEFGALTKDFLESVLDLQSKVSKRKPGKDAKTATVFLASFLSARSLKDGMTATATRRR